MGKSGYIYSIIGVEIMSILVCMILFYGNMFEHREKSKRNLLFTDAVAACLVGLIADAVSWIFDGREEMTAVLYISTVISLIMTFVINGIFIRYIAEFTQERKHISTVISRIYMAMSTVVIITIIAASKTGMVFCFEDGVYKAGPYYSSYMVANLIASLFCLVTNLLHMPFLNAHDRIASMFHIIFPWTVAFINLFYEEFSYAYPAIVLSLSLVYVMVQSERQNRLEEESLISSYHARHDVMTGLYNRLAYEEKLQELSLSEGQSGAVFADVNGLKYANDHFGHEAGDRLLKSFAELLCRHFRKEEVFRISGDEFTVLMGNAPEEIVLDRINSLRKSLAEDKVPMACVGFAYGSSSDINKLMKKAESEMYAEKEVFHSRHPEMSRQE